MNKSELSDLLNKLINEVNFSFSRSGGKGGQNVNKVETKVELTFDVLNSEFLNEEQKIRIKEKLTNRIDNEGNLRIISQTERSQLGNRKKVIKRFEEQITKALKKEKKRLPTKKSAKAKAQILDKKKKHSKKKKERKQIIIDD